jgi:hypothetical protein
MHVWYQYSMHDFLVYGLFSVWCVHGKFPCPTCKKDVMFTWLKKGGKYSSFDKHRQFLPEDHELRRDEKHFTKGVQVHDPIPRYNIDENSSNLSLFRGDLRRGGAGTNKNLQHDEWHTIMIYLLLNLEECIPYQK